MKFFAHVLKNIKVHAQIFRKIREAVVTINSAKNWDRWCNPKLRDEESWKVKVGRKLNNPNVFRHINFEQMVMDFHLYCCRQTHTCTRHLNLNLKTSVGSSSVAHKLFWIECRQTKIQGSIEGNPSRLLNLSWKTTPSSLAKTTRSPPYRSGIQSGCETILRKPEGDLFLFG